LRAFSLQPHYATLKASRRHAQEMLDAGDARKKAANPCRRCGGLVNLQKND